MDARAARAALHRLGREGFIDLALLWRAGGAPEAAYRALLETAQSWTPPEFPVRGADALALGVPKGPEVGRLLAATEVWWAEGDFRGDRAACLRKLETLAATPRT
jgi:poly(A) polymerase